jgi:predicted MFS family arabinose efflux permease
MGTSGAEERGRRAPVILVLVTLILFTDIMIYDLVVPLLPDFARMWGIDSTGQGLLFGAYGLSQLLTVPLGAWVCDRLGAVRSLRLWTVGLLLSQLLFATANGQAMLFAARALHGAAGGMAWTAGLALLASVFPAGQRGRALGMAMAGMSVGPLVGLPLGGLLFTRLGPRWPFFVTSAWTLLLVVGLAWLPSRLGHCPPRAQRRSLAAWAAFLRPASAVILGSALLSSLELTLPVHLEEMLGATPEQTGLLLGLGALLYGLSAPLAGWASDRYGGWRVLAGGLAACAVTLPLLAVPRSWGGEMVALLVFGVACAFLLSPTLPEIAAVCERQGDRAFGSAYAVFNLAYAVGMAAGPIASGVLKPALGFGLTLVTLAAAAGLSLVFLAATPAAPCKG